MRSAGGIMPPAVSRRWTRWVSFGVAFALVAAACGGGTAGHEETTTSSPRSLLVSSTASIATTVPDVSAVPDGDALDVQGHRGARGLQPENTLPAFETALDLGVSTLEFDLHLTADGDVVVWHDAVIVPEKCGLAPDAPDGTPDPDDPLTPDDELMIRSLDPAQLALYRCDRNPDSDRFPDQSADPTGLAGDDYSIVTLEELLDFVARYAESELKTGEQRTIASAVRFNMETKRKPDQPETVDDGFDGTHAGPFESKILDVIAARGLEDRVVIQSFDHRSLWAVHAEDPTIQLAALTRGGSADFEDIAARGASVWSPDHEDVTGSSLEAAHRAGLEVIPWTVNEPDVMDRLMSLGVDGLISDRPDVLLERLPSDR
jgi:glycerophosphoryl diester phosphodiesterase